MTYFALLSKKIGRAIFYGRAILSCGIRIYKVQGTTPIILMARQLMYIIDI